MGWIIKTDLLVSRYDISIFVTNLPLLKVFSVTGERKSVLFSSPSAPIKIFVAMLITLFTVKREYYVLPTVRVGVQKWVVTGVGIAIPTLRIILNSSGVFRVNTGEPTLNVRVVTRKE